VVSAVFLKSIAAFSTAATIGLGPPVTTVMPGESQVLINWVAPTLPFNGVDVEQSADSGNTWTTYLKLPPTSTHVRVQGLVDGKNYYFRVRWIWPDNSLGIPGKTLVAVPINNPNQPSGLIGTASGSQIALNWDQTTQVSVSGYEIEQSNDGGTTWKVITANTGSPSSGYLVEGLIAGTTYTYRIKALAFGGGRSDYSDAAVVKIAPIPTGGFALHYAINLSKITLTWDTPTDLPDVQSYSINASGDGGANWFTIAKTAGGVNTKNAPYVIGGSTYQVIATSSNGETSASAIELIETNAIIDPRNTASLNPVAPGSPSSIPTQSSAPTQAPTTSLRGSRSASLFIIPIAIGLIALGIGGWLIVRLRNRDAKKRPRKRVKSKRKPTNKKR
jgi:hypothetical protein